MNEHKKHSGGQPSLENNIKGCLSAVIRRLLYVAVGVGLFLLFSGSAKAQHVVDDWDVVQTSFYRVVVGSDTLEQAFNRFDTAIKYAEDYAEDSAQGRDIWIASPNYEFRYSYADIERPEPDTVYADTLYEQLPPDTVFVESDSARAPPHPNSYYFAGHLMIGYDYSGQNMFDEPHYEVHSQIQTEADTVRLSYIAGGDTLRQRIFIGEGSYQDTLQTTYDGDWVYAHFDVRFIGEYITYRRKINVGVIKKKVDDMAFSGSGSGTLADPYIITTDDQLQEMANELTAHYKLGNDIDATGTSTWNGGAGFDPVGDSSNRFVGSLDGAGFKITGLFIDRGTTDGVALFGRIDDNSGTRGEAHDIIIEDWDITGQDQVGTISALLADANVYNIRSINCTVSGRDFVGGIASDFWFNPSDVYNIEVTGLNITGRNNVGGIVGRGGNSSGVMTNCWAEGTMTHQDARYAGGVFGADDPSFNQTQISKCGAAMSGAGGGLVGTAAQVSSVTDSFFDTTVGPNTSGGGTGKTTTEMQDVATYTDTATTGLTNPWDFVGNPNDDTANDDIWDIDSGYPYLQAFVEGGGAVSGTPQSLSVSTVLDQFAANITAGASPQNLDVGTSLDSPIGYATKIGNPSALSVSPTLDLLGASVVKTGTLQDLSVASALDLPAGSVEKIGSPNELSVATSLESFSGNITAIGAPQELNVSTILDATNGNITAVATPQEMNTAISLENTNGILAAVGSPDDLNVSSSLETTSGTLTAIGSPQEMTVQPVLDLVTGMVSGVIIGSPLDMAVDVSLEQFSANIAAGGSPQALNVNALLDSPSGTLIAIGSPQELQVIPALDLATGTVSVVIVGSPQDMSVSSLLDPLGASATKIGFPQELTTGTSLDLFSGSVSKKGKPQGLDVETLLDQLQANITAAGSPQDMSVAVTLDLITASIQGSATQVEIEASELYNIALKSGKLYQIKLEHKELYQMMVKAEEPIK